MDLWPIAIQTSQKLSTAKGLLFGILTLVLLPAPFSPRALHADSQRAFQALQAAGCAGKVENVLQRFDFESIEAAWFDESGLSPADCESRMKAFRQAVIDWTHLGENSPFCRFQIFVRKGNQADLEFPYMYSYLDGRWTMAMRNGLWRVVRLPRPPEPPPYGCGLPE